MEPLYKYSVDYTWIKRVETDHQFDLQDPEERRQFFTHTVGDEIAWLREFLSKNSFVGYLLAPKNAGKGTYMKGLQEALGGDYFIHVSVGDVVRKAEEDYVAKGKESAVYKYAAKNYRGYIHLDEVFAALTSRSTTVLIPTEFVLILIKQVLDGAEKKTVFVDGFPRNLDQVSYSLYFRELINYRDDPDLFVLINAPYTVLDERIKSRVVCPECKTPRNLKLLPTKNIGYDKETKEFFLMCDQPGCSGPRMVKKEGDEFGLEPIKDRIIMDNQLMERARSLYGVPKIELYNALEADKTLNYVNDYEVTQEFYYELDKDGKIITNAKMWELEEDGKKYNSLLPSSVVVQLIRQLHHVFGGDSDT